MSDIPGFKNLRLLAQQPLAIGELSFMQVVGARSRLDKRYTLEVTFENDHVVNVPLTEGLYNIVMRELVSIPGVGIEQHMAARGAVASAGLEKKSPNERVLPLDATGEQVYDALREVVCIERVKEAGPTLPALPEATHHDAPEDTQKLFEPDDAELEADDCPGCVDARTSERTMHMEATMEALLKEIEGVLPQVKWEPTEGPSPRNAKFFQGKSRTWTFTVCSFDVSDQGLPEGSRGYDGAATSGTTVMRLTRELAEKAFKLAELATASFKLPCQHPGCHGGDGAHIAECPALDAAGGGT